MLSWNGPQSNSRCKNFTSRENSLADLDSKYPRHLTGMSVRVPFGRAKSEMQRTGWMLALARPGVGQPILAFGEVMGAHENVLLSFCHQRALIVHHDL